jgi:hypothetical protein
MLRTASLHPAERGLSLRFDGGFSPDAGSQLPGTLASPRVGLSPTGRAQLRWAHRGKRPGRPRGPTRSWRRPLTEGRRRVGH